MLLLKATLSSLPPLLILFRVTYALTQAEANARCQKKFPGYIAVANPSGQFVSCEPPPPPTPKDEVVCFELEYIDPKTGADGCCPDGNPFSYDAVSKEGKCCPEGSRYSWDAIAQKGDCCGGVGGVVECEYKCSCQPKALLKPAPTCPTGDGQTWLVAAGKTYKLTCGKYIGGASIIPCEPQPDLQSCATKCATIDGCKSVDWYNHACCYKTSAGPPTNPNKDLDNWMEVPKTKSPCDPGTGMGTETQLPIVEPRAPLPSCPSGDGQTYKTAGKTYKLTCSKMVGGTNIGNCETQPDLATCATKCAGVAGCGSVDWYRHQCCYKTQATAGILPNSEIDNWVEV